MAEPEISMTAEPETFRSGPRLNETVLRSEIAFWQEMIGSTADGLPPEAFERMHQALALAEKRLSLLYQAHSRDPVPNVYQLDQARRKRHEQ